MNIKVAMYLRSLHGKPFVFKSLTRSKELSVRVRTVSLATYVIKSFDGLYFAIKALRSRLPESKSSGSLSPRSLRYINHLSTEQMAMVRSLNDSLDNECIT